MIKSFGLILLVVCGAVLGLRASSQLTKRVKGLELFETLIELFLVKVKFTGAPVNIILTELFKYEKEFENFNVLKELIGIDEESQGENQDEFSFSDWKKIAEEFYIHDGLKKEDIPLLVEFGSQLGKSDLEGQISHCEMCSGKVRNRINNAADEQGKKSKLYLSLGVLGGIALALLLI